MIKKYIIPVIIGLALTIVMFYIENSKGIIVELSEFCNQSIAVFSILIGFLITAGIFLKQLNNSFTEFLNNSGKMKVLMDELRLVIVIDFIAIAFNLFFFLYEKQEFIEIAKFIILFVTISSFAFSWRFVKLFFKILSADL